MALEVSQNDIRRIEAARDALFLGIITAGGVVRLTESDPTAIPGHLEWLESEPIEDVVRGFSLLVKNGRVCALFRRSRLNPSADAKLEGRFVTEIETMLPLGEAYRTFEA